MTTNALRSRGRERVESAGIVAPKKRRIFGGREEQERIENATILLLPIKSVSSTVFNLTWWIPPKNLSDHANQPSGSLRIYETKSLSASDIQFTGILPRDGVLVPKFARLLRKRRMILRFASTSLRDDVLAYCRGSRLSLDGSNTSQTALMENSAIIRSHSSMFGNSSPSSLTQRTNSVDSSPLNIHSHATSLAILLTCEFAFKIHPCLDRFDFLIDASQAFEHAPVFSWPILLLWVVSAYLLRSILLSAVFSRVASTFFDSGEDEDDDDGFARLSVAASSSFSCWLGIRGLLSLGMIQDQETENFYADLAMLFVFTATCFRLARSRSGRNLRDQFRNLRFENVSSDYPLFLTFFLWRTSKSFLDDSRAHERLLVVSLCLLASRETLTSRWKSYKLSLGYWRRKILIAYSSFRSTIDAKDSAQSIAVCVVCFEDLYEVDRLETRGIRQTCNHGFHAECIERWYREQPKGKEKCPVCRSRLNR